MSDYKEILVSDTELHDDSIFGRKIFFLNPSYSINTNIIPRLQKLEYEVYKIPLYRQAKGILSINPDSICLICFDNQLTQKEWFNFIKSFEGDEKLKSIKLGIINDHIKSSTLEMYKQCTKLEAGIIKSDNNNETFVSTLVETLESLNAKGRRKYVRINCMADKETEVFWFSRNTMIKAKIIDISSVGAAILVPGKFAQFIQPGLQLNDLTIMIGPKQMSVMATVLTVKPQGDSVVGVLLLDKNTPDSIRDFIRNYVSDNLQRAMTSLTAKQPSDTTDYNFMDESSEKSDSQ